MHPLVCEIQHGEDIELCVPAVAGKRLGDHGEMKGPHSAITEYGLPRLYPQEVEWELDSAIMNKGQYWLLRCYLFVVCMHVLMQLR